MTATTGTSGVSIGVALVLLTLIGSSVSMGNAQSRDPAERPRLPLELLPDTLAVCRLEPTAPLPAWATASSPFVTVSRTREELSITVVQSAAPHGVPCERDYRALRVRGPLPLNLVGILAAIADPLAKAGLSIFAISTYDTDYVLVKTRDLDAAMAALERAGHRITR